MSLETDLYAALAPLVSNRCYPVIFPLTPPNPAWPAIRYTFVSQIPAIALCGDGGDESIDSRVQLDCVAATFAAARTLRAQVLSEMQTFDPPAVLQSSLSQYDAETKTWRELLEYQVNPSS